MQRAIPCVGAVLLLPLIDLLSATGLASPRAQEPTGRGLLGASLGYSFPLGSLEEGSRTSDVTPGIASIAVDGGYRANFRCAAIAELGYGVVIPKLCASSGECSASLGSDVTLTLGTRLYPGRLGRVEPSIELGFGYEWFNSKLTDESATSSRSYRGPVFMLAGVAAEFRVGSSFTLGPSLSTLLGAFSHSGLEASGIDRTETVDGVAVHGWLHLALRGHFEI